MKSPNHHSTVLIVSLIAALGGFLFGFDTAVISGTILFLQQKFELDAAMEGWLVSSALVGCFIGVAFAGALSDRFGRKAMLIVAASLFTVSAYFSMTPIQFSILITARIVGGCGVGVASMLSPLYISEISPAKLRGRMVALYQLAITLGILGAYFSNSRLLKWSANGHFEPGSWLQWLVEEDVWRIMFGTEMIPAILFILLLLKVPRSPRWLLKNGKEIEAGKVLQGLRDPEAANRELGEIKAILAEGNSQFVDVLQHKWRKPLIIGIVLAVASQFSGINAIIYYGPKIFNEAGFGLNEAFGSQVLIGIINVLFTFIAIWKIDQFGRKGLLLVGTSGTVISLLLIAWLFYTGASYQFLLVASFLVFIACFAFSYGPIVWVIISEIYPIRMRGVAMSIATMALWLANAIVGQAFPQLLSGVGPAATFLIFGLITLPVIWFIKIYVPETKQKTLEEIENYWLKSNE